MNRHPVVYGEAGIQELPYGDNILTPLPQIKCRTTADYKIESYFQAIIFGVYTINGKNSVTIEANGQMVIL